MAEPVRHVAEHHRRDIQGLRALAVLMVVAFHAGTSLHSGYSGVDVFFVISGYVITGSLARDVLRDERLGLGRFYARRVRRLLPALVVMIAGVAILSALIQSPLQAQQTTAKSGVAAAVSMANMELYRSTGGYFDSPAASNPMLHTWSLSVEEQFYLVLPAALALTWWLQRRRRGNVRSPLPAIATLATLGVLSFGLAWVLSHAHVGTGRNLRDLAFYSSPTRAWEFIAGALLAMITPALVRRAGRRAAAAGLCAAGAVVLLVWSAVGLHGQTAIAGPVGFVPVAAAVLAIAAGDLYAQNPLSRVLAHDVLTWIGDRSYSIYLWHWPFIVLAITIWGDRTWVAPLAAAASLVPAVLSYRYVEEPIRRRRALPRQAPRLALACIVVPVLVCSALFVGSRASWGNQTIRDLADRKGAWEEGDPACTLSGDTYRCDYATPGATGTLYLVGDSHAMALSKAAAEAGRRAGLEVHVRAYAGCPFARFPDGGPLGLPVCQQWAADTVREVQQARPDVLVVHQCARVATGCPPTGYSWLPVWEAGLRNELEAVRPSVGSIVLVDDVPRFPDDVERCVSVWGTYGSCGDVPTSRVRRDQAPVRSAEARAARGLGVTTVDPVPDVCTRRSCRQIVDGQVMYRDMDHLTTAGASRLVARLERSFRRAAAR